MIVYKLFRKLKDGSITPLFINKTKRIPLGIYMPAEDHPTKGFAPRPGWHCGLGVDLCHLSEKGRVWAECEIKGSYYEFKRPKNQGGKWVIAQELKVNRILTNDEVEVMRNEHK